jgi:hypothetical protein
MPLFVQLIEAWMSARHFEIGCGDGGDDYDACTSIE